MQKKHFGRVTNIKDIAATKKKAEKTRKFVVTVITMVATFLIMMAGCVYIYMRTLMGTNVDLGALLIDNTWGSVINLVNNYSKNRITAVVLGVDKQGLRTDVMLVGTIDKKNKKIDVISIPRDTRIKISDNNLLDMKKAKSRVPSSGVVKINAVNAYAPSGSRLEYTVSEIENMLGIDVDYYVKVDTKAFRKIIDKIGGVEFNVPRNMYWSDPLQGLYINLKKGKQVLDGNKAEQLVRFRRYHNGDLDRIKVQQDFLKAAYNQLFDVKNVTKLADIALILHEYVDTNFGVANIPEAVNIATKIDMDNISMSTLPGSPKYINGVSYFIYDKEKTKEVIDSIWNDGEEDSKPVE